MIVGFGWGAYLTLFVFNSKKTSAIVNNISSRNEQCKKPVGKKSSYDCTRFDAEISFTTHANQPITALISAGSSRGHGQTVETSEYRIGQQIEISYDMRNPSKVFSESEYMVRLIFTVVFILLGGFGTYFGYFKSKE